MGVDLENWMSYLTPYQRVIDTYIPASHNSWAYSSTADSQNPIPPILATSVTQQTDYYAQCAAGIRYFEMRYIFGQNKEQSDFYIQRFVDGFQQLRKFADNHPTEFFFLEIDFDEESLASTLVSKILEIVGDENRLSNMHVSNEGTYNTGLMWDDLVRIGAQFIVLWGKPGSTDSWAPFADDMRYKYYDNFDQKSPDSIVEEVGAKIDGWQKDKLFVAQFINTPQAPPLGQGWWTPPATGPAAQDPEVASVFNNGIMAYQAGDNVSIVSRDFADAAYNREAVEHLILMNFFDVPPMTLSVPINYLDTIRLRTTDNRYVCVRTDQTPAVLQVVDTQNENCHFLLRDYDYSPKKPFPYNSNSKADTLDCRGNFRLVHRGPGSAAPNVGKDVVVSLNTDNGALWWGVPWGPADDLETFTCYDPDSENNSGQIYHGSRVQIRVMFDVKQMRSSTNLASIVGAAGATRDGIGDNWRVFWTVRDPYVTAGQWGPTKASTFIVEKVKV